MNYYKFYKTVQEQYALVSHIYLCEGSREFASWFCSNQQEHIKQDARDFLTEKHSEGKYLDFSVRFCWLFCFNGTYKESADVTKVELRAEFLVWCINKYK